jgi:hypothetical protein
LQLISLNQGSQETAGGQKVLLPDEILQATWAHPIRQGNEVSVLLWFFLRDFEKIHERAESSLKLRPRLTQNGALFNVNSWPVLKFPPPRKDQAIQPQGQKDFANDLSDPILLAFFNFKFGSCYGPYLAR